MTPPSRLGRHLKPIAPPCGKSRTPTLVIVLAGLLLARMLTAGPADHPAYARIADSSIEFAENGTRPVGTFWAYDQDGDAIVWSLSGPDDGLFAIDGGVLAFRQPPNYEDPQSAAAGNVYRVTIEANGGRHDVTVTVADVDEAGAVSIDRPQPQVDRPLGASLSDEDEGVTAERWQWSRSGDRATWTDIEGATAPRRSPEPADVGMYLRAMVSYSDKFGPGKTASAVSARRVEARTLSNAAPSVVDRRGDEVTTVTLRVFENTAVGRPIGRRVSATDEDDDILFYELLDTPDLEDNDGVARFTIDSASGQIRVGKVLGADTREHLDDPDEREDEDSTSLPGGPALPEGEDAGEAGNNEYVLRVRVSDPSTASATVNVIVRVTNVNEPPDFKEDAPTVLRVKENPQGLPVITFGESDTPAEFNKYVTDQDSADATFSYSVDGDDQEVFTFVSGVLTFKADHKPDYEEQSSYSITVKASSGGRSTTLDVTIEVVDTEDVGSVALSQRQPQVGRTVVATLSDPDGGVTLTRWTWATSPEPTSGTCRTNATGWDNVAPDVSVGSYTPKESDKGKCLRATATYTDNIEGHGPPGHDQDTDEDGLQVLLMSERPVQDSKAANAAPEFVDQDLNSPGDQSDRTSRRVPENTEAGLGIPSPVSAMDDDGELLIYTLDGADASSFGISRDTGQLMTKASLNYEARNSYRVVVTATDPSGASDSIQVTINVTNVHDPVHITGVSSVRYPENGTAPVASFTAFDEAGHVISWSVSGRDDDLFTIDDGMLAFRAPPNYEDPQSAADSSLLFVRNIYRVTVEAAGGTRNVTVRVTDVDEAGTASIDRPQPQVSRPLSASLLDEDDLVDDQRWQWARSVDVRAWTNIEGATEPQRRPSQEDVGRYLRATVTYSDKFGPRKTASAVSVNRVELTTLFNAAPSFTDQDDDEDTPYVDVARSVSENTAAGMPVGEPVSASDSDEDILFYELLDTPDLEDGDDDARFTIDSLTGQIRAGRQLGADPDETEDEDSTALTGGPALPEDENAGVAGNSEYVLRVRVSDPSTASAIVNVIVTVANVNEAPEFDEDVPTLLRVEENQKNENNQEVNPPVITLEDGETPLEDRAYAVTDEDGVTTGPDAYDDTSYTYSLSGADRIFFTLDRTAGTLGFRSGHRPDFEYRSSYSITITARSGEGARGLSTTLDVTIEVVDTEDPGTVDLSQRQPEVGIAIHATASDADGGVIVRRWVWEWSVEVKRNGDLLECRDESGPLWKAIAEATSAVYVPKAADVGRCLRARAFYVDNVGRSQDEDEATGVLKVPVGRHGSFDSAPTSDGGFVNAPPVFPDQDYSTEGDQSESTSREVLENTEKERSIGAPVSAHDEDDDLLIYTLSGPDAEFFRIGRNDGQLKTEAPLNFEVRSSYSVVVTATDPFGATDSIVVTIKVTDEDDPAVITVLKR